VASGASTDFGILFNITPGGSFTTRCTFAGNNGAYPNFTPILASDGNFYGTTRIVGTTDDGTVFRVCTQLPH
jgi:uncharacterized repeat protein (TIGR03803 family)